jgi:hypothetical protein
MLRPGVTDRRIRAERRLFDAHARLERSRAELAIVEELLLALSEVADEARVRMLVSETALADREWNEARRHAEVMERSRDATLATIAELERLQDELLSQLLP